MKPHNETAPVSIPRAPTRMRGIDDVLCGGLAAGRTTLIGGGPGTGKTIFALEQLYRAALEGEPGVFVTFEEQADLLRRNALSLGWDLEPLERSGKLVIMHVEVPIDALRSGDFDLEGFLAILNGELAKVQAERLVLDAMDVLLRLFPDNSRREDQLFRLYSWLSESGMTALLTVKSLDRQTDAFDRIEYMSDCVLRLDQRVVGQVATKRLRVLKFRGSDFQSNEFPYVISTDGFVLMPVSRAGFPQQPLGDLLSTGIEKLDEVLGGGFRSGASVVIGGATGAGKTSLACTISKAAADRGERTLLVSFEDGVDRLVSAMKSPGIDLQPALDKGRLRVLTAMPESLGVEAHLHRILRVFEEFGPNHFVVDAISAAARMGSEGAAFEFILRLLTHCRSHGVTCIFVDQTGPNDPVGDVSKVGISSLFDLLLVLQQSWSNNTHERELLVIKLRGTAHSHIPHRFRITDEGITLDGPAAASGESGS